MIPQKVEQAVLNNAFWCDMVCASHGRPGKFLDEIWINRRETPPYYPNAITLNKATQKVSHHERISQLMDAGLPSGWGVKDSFATLALDSLGFEVLLEAQWIYKPVTSLPQEMGVAEVEWETVGTAAALKEWERAWSAGRSEEEIFLPSLLLNLDVAIVAARRAGRIVAGFIVNYAAGCAGVSNIFLPEEETQEFCNDCMAMAQSKFPNLPLVGYESGSVKETMLSAGFEVIGDLRVWLCQV